MATTSNDVEEFVSRSYDAGFVTDLETDTVPPGLSEEVIAFISRKKNEPKWLLQWRLDAYRHWLTLEEPDWATSLTHPSTTRQAPTTQPQSQTPTDPKV